MKQSPEKISIIMPCLNEEKTVGSCVLAAKKGLLKLSKLGFIGEIIVVDNGSTDQSANFAQKAGAKVVFEKRKGYGAAYQKGIRLAQGRYIVIGDSDGTYDFRVIPSFIDKLEEGWDLVLGSRSKGKIRKGSMPFLHRHVGNPVLTAMINLFYGGHISDSQTGFRAFTKKTYQMMQLKSYGMDFASEMILKTIACKLKIAEIPINYSPRVGRSKLSPVKDAWRHITSILIYSPTYAFVLPGIIIFLLGLTITLLLLPGPFYIGKRYLDIHTMIMGVLATSLGLHIILTGFFTRVYTVKKLGIKGGILTRLLLCYLSLESLFMSGVILTTFALGIIGTITFSWALHGFSALAEARKLIAAGGLGMMGGQLIFSSFLFELLQKDV